MLTKCVICGFNVRDDDEFCLNCGFILDDDLPANQLKTIIISTLFSLPSSFLIANLLFPNGHKNSHGFFLLTSLFFFVILFALLFIPLQRILNKPRPKRPESLNDKEKIIEKRVSNLLKRGQNIDSVLDKIKEADGQNLQEVRRKLLTAREIVMSQFARYELQKQKIELVRLQNGVSPYLFKLHRLNEFQTEDGLVTIENTRHEINKIRTILTRFDAIEFPRNTLLEKENFLAQLSETEHSCQNLREALLSKQATHALQGISPIAEKLKLPHTNELAHTAETFNLQTTLTGFSESFEELEREYRRVQSESEISQKILTDEI